MCAIQCITGDHRDLLHAAEHIQLRQGNLVCALTGKAVAAGHTVKGADTARTAGGSTILTACLAQLFIPVLAHGVLGGKGACTHAGGVGFQHAHHVIQFAIGDACAQRRIGCQRVGAGSEREDAVIDIPHGTQLGFQHDAFAAVVGLLQKCTHITDIRCKLSGLHPAPFQQSIVAHGFLMIAAAQFQILGFQDRVQTVLHTFFVQMQQVAQTQGLFAVFIAVGVGNAAAGRAKGRALLGKAILFQAVLHLVPRHGDGGLIRKLQVFRAYLYAALLNGIHFSGQMVEVDHHASTQHTDNVRVQDAGGQQVQDELALLRYNGVAGIVAALIAGNHIGMFG